ncbi:hypothetical protein F1728_10665 [Gimesia benthica]|uniref:Coiled coil domain-containing protein n=1 Tax=Gimesia benthica TaxID=2608982 RepID=A0A6I6A9F6_9PLAN|nr:hypothetical protein [Gimesia benthica]QGQ23104.1 hypothetical protein F1728_10665 [Gimesia benthica]
MKYVTPCCLCLSLFLVACANEDTSETVVVKKPVADPVTEEDVSKEFGEAFETTKKFTQQKHDEYAAKLDKQLRELNVKIDQLQEKGSDLKDDAKVKWNEQMDELKVQRDHVSEKLEEFNNASADAWEGLKQDLDTAWENLENSFDNAENEIDEEV